jgi:tRNA(fMet)-specific endonuclease VapC
VSPKLRTTISARTLMAGQALQRGLVLVTANTAEFQRVGGLRWENWAA